MSLILLMVFPSCKVDSDEDTKPEPKAKYTVSFDSNGGTAVESQTVESGSKATKPKAPTKVGYSLSSWRNENSAFDFSTPITKNLNLVAVWQANKYTVALVNNGNRSEITATYDSNLSNLSTIPTLENSEFGGYYTEPFAKGTKYIDSEGKGCHVWDIANDDTILYAAWGYKINYENTKDLENPNPEIYTGEERLVLSDLKSITGYNFVGWYDSKTEGNKVTSIESGETGAKTLYARWEAVNYTISYDINGGKLAEENENPTSFTIESDTITLKTPAKNGYTFAGWYRDGTKVTEIPKGTTENIDLTAEWSIVTYPITYDLNKGTNSDENPSSYTIETDTITLKAATREGHDFVGWYDDDKEGNKIESIQKGDFGEKKLYARWEAKTYTISYDLDGGVLEEENPDSYTIVKKSDEVIMLNEPTKDGYTFLGWYFNGEKYTEISFGTIGNLSFKAMWSLVSYTINYELNGGTNSGDNPSSYNSETATIILKDATRTGYEFLGWYDSNIDGNKITSVPKGSFGEKTLYAKWKLTTYTISYDLNGGTMAEEDENQTYYTVESETITLNEPTKDGYTFEGWFAGENQYAQILHGTSGNLALTAKWALISYPITYELFGGINSDENPASYNAETPATTLEGAVKVGYNFIGWYDSDWEGNKVTQIGAGELGARLLYARFEPVNYTISYDLNGGKLAEGNENPTYYTVESETIILNSPTRSTYVFDGWYSNGKKYEKILHGTTGDLTLSAKWTPIAIYAVSFNANASDVTGSMSNIYAYSQTSVTLPENAFARSGYIFMGWATSSTGEKVYDDKAQITLSRNLILYAVWLEESYVPYTVQHLLQNAEDDDYTLESMETKYGKILSKTNAQPKTFEHFVAMSVTQKTLPISGTTTVQVLYNREIVTISLDSANGDEVQNIRGKWGASYTKNENPERHGYTFSKWQPALPATLESKTCTAVWNPISYSISYEGIEGATNQNIGTYTIEDEISLQDARKTGYTFLGWYKNGENMTEIPLGSTGNITLTAQWTPTSYSISYEGIYGAENPNTSSYTIESETIALQDASKNGYTFLGWYSNGRKIAEIPFGLIGDKIITARWSPISYSISYAGISGAENPNTVMTYTIESETIALQDASKTGYTFLGWYDGTKNISEISHGSIGNVTLTAKWSPISYSISYTGISGAENPNTVTSYTIESETITLQDAIKTGYTFLGWYDGTKNISEISHGSIGNVAFTAKWKKNSLSPTVTLESVTSMLPALSISLEDGTFKATDGFKSYLWKIDGQIAKSGEDNTYKPNAETLSSGHHNITLFVTSENGSYNSVTAVFTVNK